MQKRVNFTSRDDSQMCTIVLGLLTSDIKILSSEPQLCVYTLIKYLFRITKSKKTLGLIMTVDGKLGCSESKYPSEEVMNLNLFPGPLTHTHSGSV